MKTSLFRHPLLQCGVLWCTLIATVLLTRPLLATIETRAMAVAWEMHVTGNHQVPTLNFKPYTQKPPMLAWLINAGWALVGIKRYVATLITAAFSFGCLIVTYLLAQSVWPTEQKRVQQAVWIAFGAVIFQLYGTLVFYDYIMAFFALLAIYAVWRAAQDQRKRWWMLYSACLGLGILTKGPAMAVQIVPVALLAPVWSTNQTINWRRWYGAVALSFLAGSAIGLAWALPAAVRGGPEYGNWILFQQTTHRVTKAFSHKEAWYYYLEMLPLFVLPWACVPAFWRTVPHLKTMFKTDTSVRFLMCWAIPVFVIFSLISGKQLHYILPLYSAAALFLTRLLPDRFSRHDFICSFLVFLLAGFGWLALVAIQPFAHLHISPLVGDALLSLPFLPMIYFFAIAFITYGAIRSGNPVPGIALAMAATLIAFHVACAPLCVQAFQHGADR